MDIQYLAQEANRKIPTNTKISFVNSPLLTNNWNIKIKYTCILQMYFNSPIDQRGSKMEKVLLTDLKRKYLLFLYSIAEYYFNVLFGSRKYPQFYSPL